MSLNTEFGHANPDEIVRAVREGKVDVLVLTEATTSLLSGLSVAGIEELLPHQLDDEVDARSSNGTVIMADRDLLPLAVPKFSEPAFAMPAATVVVGTRSVVIRAVHTYPPLPGWSERWHAALDELGTWQYSLNDRALIMAGDFNAGPGHPAYRRATEGLTDAAGIYRQATWPADTSLWPFATIDHIVTRQMSSTGFTTLRIGGTDHLGIRASLQLCAAGGN